MTKLLKSIIAFAIVSFSAQQGWTWGKIGHETVALIAESQLTPEVADQIEHVLEGMSMAEAAVWPDIIKQDELWTHASPYHYLGISDDNEYLNQVVSLEKDKQALGDVLRALVKAEDTLTSMISNRYQKKWALAFMIHFMGDIHQPLHTGRPEDRGGNDVKLNYFGVKSNLHAVWDSGIIMATLNLRPSGSDTNASNPNTKNYLNHLRKPSQAEIKQWANSYIMDWTMESFEPRPSIYKDWRNNSDEYQNKYANLVDDRVLKAGYRLGTWLNTIFKGNPFQPKKSSELRKTLERALGKSYLSDISLEPQYTTGKKLELIRALSTRCTHTHE